MDAKPLIPIFYVNAQGVAYAPIPQSRALVADIAHDRLPRTYTLNIMDKFDASPLFRQRLVRQFLAKTHSEGTHMMEKFEREGVLRVDFFTAETGEMKKFQLAEDGKRYGYCFAMILEIG